MPWALAVCGLLSVGLHLLLLLGTAGTRSDSLSAPPYRATEAARALRVHVIEGQPAAAPGPRVAQTQEASVSQAPPSEPARKTPQAPTSGSSGSARTGSDPPQPPSEFDAYLPRHLLSEPPAALTEIVIEPPAEEKFPGRRVGILTLFIDEEGQVRHVAPDDLLLLPAELEQLAREAFMAGRFSPGLVAGNPTKSRMRVEVVFE